MPKEQLLPFIENEKLYGHVKKVLICWSHAVKEAERDLF